MLATSMVQQFFNAGDIAGASSTMLAISTVLHLHCWRHRWCSTCIAGDIAGAPLAMLATLHIEHPQCQTTPGGGNMKIQYAKKWRQ